MPSSVAPTAPRGHRRLAQFLVPLLLALMAVFAFAPGAANALDLTSPGQAVTSLPVSAVSAPAAPVPTDFAGDPSAGAGTSDVLCASNGLGDSDNPMNCLPVVRWMSATQLHENVQFDIANPLNSINSATISKVSVGLFMTITNAAWWLAALALDAATNFTIANAIAQPINGFAAAFGRSMIDSGAIYLLIGVGLLGFGWAGMRGRFQLKRLLYMAGAIAAVTVMTMGAMNDSGEGSTYRPGEFSPAWIVGKTGAGVRYLTDPVARSVSDSTLLSTHSSVFDSGSAYSCSTYIDSLNDSYREHYEDRGLVASEAPIAVSNWWVATSYRVFSSIQYGQEQNWGADFAACQQLEANAGVSPERRQGQMIAAIESKGGNTSFAPATTSAALVPKPVPNRMAQQVSFFGVCEPQNGGTYGLRGDMPDVEGGVIGGPFDPESCATFATANASDVPSDPDTADTAAGKAWGVATEFLQGQNSDEYKDMLLYPVGHQNILKGQESPLVSTPQALNFHSNTTGVQRDSWAAGAFILAISSIPGAAAMIFLSGALFLMKILSYIMAAFLILAAFAAIISQGTGSAVSFGKQWLGYTIITNMTALLISFVMLVAQALMKAGETLLGNAMIPTVLWIGVVPAISVLLLNWTFKKMFKAKSPFTLRGMQAMASSPGLAAAAGAGGVGIMGQMLDNAKREGINRATRSGIGMVTGSGRTGKGVDTGAQGPGAGKKMVAGAQGEDDTQGVESKDGASAQGAVDSNAKATAQTAGADQAAQGATAAVGAGAEDEGVINDVAAPGIVADAEDAHMLAGSQNMSLAEQLAAHNSAEAMAGRLDARRDLHERLARVGDRLNVGGDRAVAALKGAPMAGAAAVSAGAVNAWKGLGARAANAGKGAAALLKEAKENPASSMGFLAAKAGQKVTGAATSLSAPMRDAEMRKKMLKGAALYGGLGLATGGVGLPAAVFAGRTLMKNKDAIVAGPRNASEALVGSAREAYSASAARGGMDDRETQSALEERIYNRRLDQLRKDQKGLAADGSDHLALAGDLPHLQDTLLDRETQAVTAALDEGRTFDPAQLSAEAPHYAAVHGGAETEQGHLDLRTGDRAHALGLPSEAPEGFRPYAAPLTTSTTALPAQTVRSDAAEQVMRTEHTVQGEGIKTERAVQGRTHREVQNQDRLIQGPDTVESRSTTVEHDAQITNVQGPDVIEVEKRMNDVHVPGNHRVENKVTDKLGKVTNETAGSGLPAQRMDAPQTGAPAQAIPAQGETGAQHGRRAERSMGTAPAQAQAAAVDGAPSAIPESKAGQPGYREMKPLGEEPEVVKGKDVPIDLDDLFGKGDE